MSDLSGRRRLTLLRHAKSSWEQPGLADRDRPLSARGLRDAPRIAARLREAGARPSLIVSSPATRTLTTARLFADALGLSSKGVVTDDRMYLATASELLDVIADQDESLEDLLLVGHNPGLTVLANRLLPTLQLDNLPTTGVVAMDLMLPVWSAAATCGVSLAYYDFPKNPAQRPLSKLPFRR